MSDLLIDGGAGSYDIAIKIILVFIVVMSIMGVLATFGIGMGGGGGVKSGYTNLYTDFIPPNWVVVLCDDCPASYRQSIELPMSFRNYVKVTKGGSVIENPMGIDIGLLGTITDAPMWIQLDNPNRKITKILTKDDLLNLGIV